MSAHPGLEFGASPLEHPTSSRRTLVSVGFAVLVGVAASVLVARSNYLLFHTLVELVTVIVAVVIGVVAWYTFGFSRNHFLAFLGAAYPAVALLDLVHALAYQGMGVFPVGTDPPTQLWIAARGLEAIALLLAPRYLERPVPLGLAFSGFGLGALILLGLIGLGLFPTMHIEGQGLTPVKIAAEYAIIAMLAAAGDRLWRRRSRFDAEIQALVTGALLLTAVAELLFTFYIGVYDLSNLLGHIAKLASFGLIFLGLVRTSLLEPFRILNRNSTTYDAIPDEIVVVDRSGAMRQVNRVVEANRAGQVQLGGEVHRVFHPAYAQKPHCPVCQAIAEGQERSFELYYPKERRWRQITLAPIRDRKAPRAMVHIARDITPLKEAQNQLRRLNRSLRAISASNHTLIHATDETQLLHDVCDIVVAKGGYRMAWVGYPEEGPERLITPQAWAGAEYDYLQTVRFSWGDNPLGQGPAGIALRTGKPCILNDLANAPGYDPWREAALGRGYAAAIAFPLTARYSAIGVLVIYAAESDAFNDEEVAMLEELAGDLAYGINALRTAEAREVAENRARRWYKSITGVLKQTVAAVAGMVEMRDPYTAGHQRRVAELAVAIGRELQMESERLEGLYVAGLIHDIGKLHIPAEILTRPGKLNDLEFEIIKTHPRAGYDILKDIAFPWPVAEMVMEHQERLDGSGYPQGLKGDAIRLESRILAIADTVDAIASHRPYRASLGIDFALSVLREEAGTRYDAEAVAACIRLFTDGQFAAEVYGQAQRAQAP